MKISIIKLTAAMVDAGIDTSEQLAHKAGVSVNTISRLRHGGSAKVVTIRKLAEALNVSSTEIME